MQVVVDLLVLRQRGVVGAVTQTENRLEVRHVHACRQLSTPVPSLEKNQIQNRTRVTLTPRRFTFKISQ